MSYLPEKKMKRVSPGVGGLVDLTVMRDRDAVIMVDIRIDGHEIHVPAGTTILESAQKVGVRIPTLCAHPDLRSDGSCWVCVVEVEADGVRTLQTSCDYRIHQPITVHTHSREIRQARRLVVESLLAEHNEECCLCDTNSTCELQALAKQTGAKVPMSQRPTESRYDVDNSSKSIVRDMNRCVLCGRCLRTCAEFQGVACLNVLYRKSRAITDTPWEGQLNQTLCIDCGQCVNHCPTGALRERDATSEVWAAIDDPRKHVVIQTASAPRVSIGECFGLPPGRSLTFELNTALRQCGFDRVVDTTFFADLALVEAGTELLIRLYQTMAERDTSVALPMLFACSPGWVRYLENVHPEYLPNLSTTKSAQQIVGVLLKTHYARLRGIDPRDIVSVALMPCTAKKYECQRPDMAASGYRDVDYVLTTREMATMFHEIGIDLPAMDKSHFDDPFGVASGSGIITGVTGGVTEATLRMIIELVTGDPVEQYFDHAEIPTIRGMEGIRTAKVTIPKIGDVPPLLRQHIPSWDWLEGATLKLAMFHGIANGKKVLANIKAGGELASYHFIEAMACPGGCIGGGGQPTPTNAAIREARARALYAEGRGHEVRKAHTNPAVVGLYRELLTDGPCGHISQELLHTSYTPRVMAVGQTVGGWV